MKYCRPILVEAKEDTGITLGLNITRNMGGVFRGTHFRIVLVSLDERVDLGDLFVELNVYETRHGYTNKIYTCDIGNTGTFILTKEINFPFTENCHKVIACSDTSLNQGELAKPYTTVSLLSDEYIQRFIQEYNDGNVKDVDLDTEHIFADKKHQPTVVSEQEMVFTEEEVWNLLGEFSGILLDFVEGAMDAIWNGGGTIPKKPDLLEFFNAYKEVKKRTT